MELKLCVCGCGKPLVWQKHHKYRNIKYIHHHFKANLGRDFSIEWKQNISRSNLGYKRSDETKKRMSEAMQKRKIRDGYMQSPEARKKISNAWKNNKFALGCKHSIESRQQMSHHHADVNGNKNPNWRGGIQFEPYSPEFDDKLKKQIKERDKCCRYCYTTIKRLNIHHIDYNKKNSIHSNLISLCVSCHMKTNFNRKYWTNYFQRT